MGLEKVAILHEISIFKSLTILQLIIINIEIDNNNFAHSRTPELFSVNINGVKHFLN